MKQTAEWRQLAPDLYLFPDACNVYLLRDEDRALVVDFGSGAWHSRLEEIGVKQIDHVVLTHAHRDQLYGLYRSSDHPYTIHAPAGDGSLLRPPDLAHFWKEYQANGCPTCYAAPRLPLDDVRLDLAGDTETLVGPARFCAIATPGHTPGALTYLVEWRGRHLAFCGDATHSGGKLHQLYHLEWDHWTPSGCLAAWHGLERLSYCHFDLLLPSHGPIVDHRPRTCVRQVQKRLLDLISAKGSVCAGAKSTWLDLERLACGARRILPHLYHFGSNSFLLASDSGEGLVVDPQLADIDQLPILLQEIGPLRITAGIASHYHMDHSDGLDFIRREYGARIWLHPWVAEPIVDRNRLDVPWLPTESIVPDRILPENGPFRWCEYRFASHAFPGQTRWHTAFDTHADGRHVLFSGDNYQPPTRWNGTGGFCSFNGSRFRDGFAHSARTVLDIAPEIICNGHGCIYRFASSQYRRILRWTKKAEKAVGSLCPSPQWLADYDCRAARWEPFVTQTKPGRKIELSFVYQNHFEEAVALLISPAVPPGWQTTPANRRVRIPAGKQRRAKFTFQIPQKAEKGRHLIAADLLIGDQLIGEACVAIVDIV